MSETKRRWRHLTSRAKHLQFLNTSHSGEDCHYQDVMRIYDHEADDAIDRLNVLQDIVTAANICRHRDSIGHCEEVAVSISHDEIEPKSIEVVPEFSKVLPEEVPLLPMGEVQALSSEMHNDIRAPLARIESFEDGDPSPAFASRNGENDLSLKMHIRTSSFTPQAIETASVLSEEMDLDPSVVLAAVKALAEDRYMYLKQRRRSSGHAILPPVFPETIPEDEVLTTSRHQPEPYWGTGNKYYRTIADTGSVSSIGETPEPILRRRADFSMSAPVGIQFTEVEQHAAFVEVREFLMQKKYKRFFRTLLRAVKSDSEHAVKVMVEILRTFGYDLCEPQFRECIYTASILHVALLFKRENICRLLIKAFPGLVRVKYTSEKFRNQTAIHIAASNGQCDILTEMLSVISKECSADILNTVADGTYFKDFHPEGALVLSAAAWNGHPTMFGMLIDNGADLDIRGPKGNTVLHYIVTLSAKYPQSDIPKRLFDVVWEKCVPWWQRCKAESKANEEFECGNKRKMQQVDAIRYLLLLKNNADQNILSLAVNLHSNLTMRILNIEHIYKQPQTKFGAITWSTYDVTEVTSYLPRDKWSINRYNPGSVLHILAHRAKVVTTEEEGDYNDLIEEEPILTLVEMKWSTYRWVYIVWCLIHLALMIGLSVVSIFYAHEELHQVKKTALLVQTNLTNGTYNLTTPYQSSQRKVYLSYLVFAIVPIIYLILEMVDVFSTGYRSMRSLNPGIGKVPSLFSSYFLTQWSITGNAPYRVCGFAFSICVLSWLGLHLCRSDDQDIPLSLAMVFGWTFMLLFTRCCRYICRFSIMMQKMFFQDCLYFIAVYIFFWLAFSTAIHVLVLYGDQHTSVWTTLYGMLNVVTDAGDKASGNEARIPGVAGALLSIYAVISVILLVNMLIAMMNSSYEAVKSSKTNIWRNQQLSVILMIERRLWWWVWLCEKSQRHTWSPQTSASGVSKDETSEAEQPDQRLYLEITEKSWQQPRQENHKEK